MRAVRRWLMGCALAVPVIVACGSKKNGTFDNSPSATPPAADDASSSSGSSSSGGGDGAGPQLALPADGGGPGSTTDVCKGGHYVGAFDGSYSSHLIFGIPLTVSGNVDMTLNQAGSPGMMCTFAGETESCSNFYRVEGGTVTGVANSTMIGDAAFGGYPYFCSLTGTLDCKAKKLVDGWIQCTYCVGPLADGGMACVLGGGSGGTGIGGQFAGPVSAAYDYGTLAFVNGTWNGAEALAGNDGGSPGPDGSSMSSVLALDGGYGIGNYGGSGTWNAVHQ